MNAQQQNLAMQKAYHSTGDTAKNVVVHALDTGLYTLSGYRAGQVTGDMIDKKHDYKGGQYHAQFVCHQIARGLPNAEIRSKRIIPGGALQMLEKLTLVYNEAKAEPNKLHIVNMSVALQTNSYSESVKKVEQMVDKLVAMGVVVVVAAGNDGNEPMYLYPATFQSPICITAIYDDGSRALFSNYPKEADFCEAGVNILLNIPRPGESIPRWTNSGTSMACPEFVVKVGLVGSRHMRLNNGRKPTEQWLYDMLKAMVTYDLGSAGWDQYYGWGYVDIMSQAKTPRENPLPYVTDLGLLWPDGRSPRDITDHIQVHHTVGNYDTPGKWADLHKRRQIEDGYRGIEYSFGINSEGTIFEGRGLDYKHGAVKNSETENERGIGAADRSVSVTLIGDMRKEGFPTAKQYASLIRLLKDLCKIYSLPASAILGHKEVPTYKDRKPTGKLYATACPVIDMDKVRADIGATPVPDPKPEPKPEPEVPPMGEKPVNTFTRYYYGGASFVNLREQPSTKAPVLTKVTKNENVIVMDEVTSDGTRWFRVLMYDRPDPMPYGWAAADHFIKGRK